MSLDFDPTRTPPAPKPAASVLVLRENEGKIEIFCVRRHQKSGFLGGAVVFPGGKVDAADMDPAWTTQSSDPPQRTAEFTADAGLGRAFAIAACRETLEEGGICPFTTEVDDAQIAALRADLSRPLRELLQARSLRLDLGALIPFGRWVTPEAESRRFDAVFYLTALPPGQTGKHDNHETITSFWERPGRLLERWSRGELFLAPPTVRCLELLLDVTTYTEAQRVALTQSLLPVCPHFVPANDEGLPFLALPGDPAHPVAERRVTGPSRFVLRDGRFVSEEPR